MEKMTAQICAGVARFHLFGYCACDTPDSAIFRRVIVWVFSRMNQISFAFQGEPVFRPYRRPFDVKHRATGPGSSG
ncbi:hypothetical protein [Burkholderia sola]|uniref:hypothetical protein n=1 Tax=Burkholderia sola TaxID=2843302 RepID=UPI0023DDB592|nr:hypothetical protein [Burkholderia sola]MDF3085020.1 hypothetical protein [Burkholderia sola]